MRRTTYFCGHPLRMWRNEPLLRLFRTDRVTLQANPAASADALLHEAWSSAGSVGELRGTLLHFSYPDVASYRAKYDRYTSLEAPPACTARFSDLSARAPRASCGWHGCCSPKVRCSTARAA